MSQISLVSILLLCVVVRYAKQFRLQCTLESLQWRQCVIHVCLQKTIKNLSV